MTSGTFHAARVLSALCRAQTASMTTTIGSIALLVLLWGGIAPRAAAQTDNPAFNEWWERVTAGGREGPPIDGLLLRSLVFEEYFPPEAELQAMRERVAGKPDHPEKRKLAGYEYLRSSGERVPSRRSIWRLGGRWRYNIDTAADGSGVYTDYVWADDAAWELSKNKLGLALPDGKSPRSQVLASLQSGLGLYASMFLRTGWSLTPTMRLSVQLSADGTWRAEASEPDSSLETTAAGSWDATRGVGRIRQSTYRRLNSPPDPNSDVTHEVVRWHPFGGLGLDVAAEVRTKNNADGRMVRRYQLEEIRTFTPAEFDALMTIPKPGGTDAERGPVTYTVVVDDRPGAPSRAWSSAAQLDVQVTNPLQEPSRVPLRVVGWAVIAVISATLVWLYCRSRKRAVP